MSDNTSQQLFSINIIDQGWIDDDDSAEDDLCSHGKIRLVIGGQLIASGEVEYGISESALALLRTLDSDHSKSNPLAQRLIFHGCGTMLLMGCPVGIDWELFHFDDQVGIENVVRYDTTDENNAIRFNDLSVVLSECQYRQEVVKFAGESKELFRGIEKKIDDEFDREQYVEFWEEYDQLLGRFSSIDIK
jgi:hypothetical protein